jgi:hypothetical protein
MRVGFGFLRAMKIVIVFINVICQCAGKPAWKIRCIRLRKRTVSNHGGQLVNSSVNRGLSYTQVQPLEDNIRKA